MKNEIRRKRDIYVTKWWSRWGIVKCSNAEVVEYEHDSGNLYQMAELSIRGGLIYIDDRDFSYTLKAARSRVAVLADAKLRSLRKQIDKIDTIRKGVQDMKVVDYRDV